MINVRPRIYYSDKHIYLKFIHVLFSRNILKNDLNRIQRGGSELWQANAKVRVSVLIWSNILIQY